MRRIEEDIKLRADITFGAAGVQVEVELPHLGDRIAYMAKSALINLDPATAAPTSVAAGLCVMELALSGRDQTIPPDLFDLDEIIAMAVSASSAAGAGSGTTLQFYNVYPTWGMRPILFKELFLYAAQTNIATFPGYRLAVFVDAYQLTTSEYVDLLD